MKKLGAAFLAIILVAIGTIFIFAQKADGDKGKFRRGFGHRGFAKMAEKLNLTDAQKEQFKQIREASKSKVQPLWENMKSVRQQLQAATANGQFNETQVQALATQQANIMAQLIVEKERTKSQMFAVLTPEQQSQAKAIKEQMKERFKQRFQNRGNKDRETDF